MKLHAGGGAEYRQGWLNVDSDPAVRADRHDDPVAVLLHHAAELTEVDLGKLLAQREPAAARELLDLLADRLPPGTPVTAGLPGWCASPADLAALLAGAGLAGAGLAGAGLAEAEPAPEGDPGPEVTEVLLGRTRLLREQIEHEQRSRRDLQIAVAAVTGDRNRLGLAADQARREAERVQPQLAAARAEVETAQRELAETRDVLADTRDTLTDVRGSTSYAVATRLAAAGARVLPSASPARAILGHGVAALRTRRGPAAPPAPQPGPPPALPSPPQPAPSSQHTEAELVYHRWCSRTDPGPTVVAAQRERSRQLTGAARILVVVLPGPAEAVRASVDSIRTQSYGHLEVVALGGEPDDGVDARLRRHDVPLGQDPLAAANDVVAASTADFVLLLPAGDLLGPDCLFHVGVSAYADGRVDLVHWDDDLVDPRGGRRDPRFRPSWSPELLLSANYLGWSFALRRTRFQAAGGLRPDVGAAAVWDLLLRLDLDAGRVHRVPRVLAHLAAHRDEVGPAGVRAVADHLAGCGVPATATLDAQGVRLTWRLPAPPSVSVVICTRHNRSLLARCFAGLRATEYRDLQVVVVDNGGRSDDNERWYAENGSGLDLAVHWWDAPFNYSAVNNLGARQARGEVLVFCNDDTEATDPGWLTELVGWATRPGIGLAGLQLLGPAGRIQHAGAVLGLGGFADHVFEGMEPGSPSMLGPTGRYRDVLAVTGACLAVRREVFDALGGLDERFTLCGSDVALGLTAHRAGLRTVCSPYHPIHHHESATRGTHVPREDFFASYWQYQTYLFGGDPYFSPNLSLSSREPALREPDEPTVGQLIAGPLERSFTPFRQKTTVAETTDFARGYQARAADAAGVRALHARERAPFDVRTVTWFIPDLDSPFYGGINTALRIADQLARVHGVENRFLTYGSTLDFVRSGIATAFPRLAGSPVVHNEGTQAQLETLPEGDVGIATLWGTAYALAHAPNFRRKFYLIQDFEPMFYPAGSMYALAEESYRLGLYGLCNTGNLLDLYHREYAGAGLAFTPAVDASVFHARGRRERDPGDPVTVFVYARPGHWRNCWEMASLALQGLKDRLGGRVRIVTAGAWAVPEELDRPGDMTHLGLLDYRATGELYRQCDVGLALTVSRHPSYLPLELMACGVPVVAFDNPWGHWLLRDERQDRGNALLAEYSVPALTDRLERLCVDSALRERLRGQALADLATRSDWDAALAPIYPYLCAPEGVDRP